MSKGRRSAGSLAGLLEGPGHDLPQGLATLASDPLTRCSALSRSTDLIRDQSACENALATLYYKSAVLPKIMMQQT